MQDFPPTSSLPFAAAVKDHRARPSVSQSVSPSAHPTDDQPPTRAQNVFIAGRAGVEHYQRCDRGRGAGAGAGGEQSTQTDK